ncbi:hypothetical protein BCR44DRAFT_35466 [Catenaria anguillulae PL171]|uniref:Uncharacterized protein n=1 Tax=Catenaria anguillulae PL171 TaxID=765915 RepID=A0A1Y2HPV5_9FUNG|nr:hypothetical protein BCR44DRAFT_35466 [Catenaria anguillulae PL171]
MAGTMDQGRRRATCIPPAQAHPPPPPPPSSPLVRSAIVHDPGDSVLGCTPGFSVPVHCTQARVKPARFCMLCAQAIVCLSPLHAFGIAAVKGLKATSTQSSTSLLSRP